MPTAPTKNKTEMEYGDLAYCMERMLGMFYIRTNLPDIMKFYGFNRTRMIEAMNNLMEKGQEGETWKYWESTQTIADHIATGRM